MKKTDTDALTFVALFTAVFLVFAPLSRHHQVFGFFASNVSARAAATDHLRDSDRHNTVQQAASLPTQGAGRQSIPAKGNNASLIVGLNSTGTKMENNLANLDALLHIIASGLQIFKIVCVGLAMLLMAYVMSARSASPRRLCAAVLDDRR